MDSQNQIPQADELEASNAAELAAFDAIIDERILPLMVARHLLRWKDAGQIGVPPAKPEGTRRIAMSPRDLARSLREGSDWGAARILMAQLENASKDGLSWHEIYSALMAWGYSPEAANMTRSQLSDMGAIGSLPSPGFWAMSPAYAAAIQEAAPLVMRNADMGPLRTAGEQAAGRIVLGSLAEAKANGMTTDALVELASAAGHPQTETAMVIQVLSESGDIVRDVIEGRWLLGALRETSGGSS